MFGVDPKKSLNGIETEEELSDRRLCWRLTWWGFTEKNEASHLLVLRGRHQYLDQHSNQNRAPCVLSTAVGTEEEENQMPRSSAQREQLTEEGRAGRLLMKREKSTELRTDPSGTLRWTRKERLL